jgi:transposase
MKCWRKLRDWYHAGVWSRFHLVLLEELAEPARTVCLDHRARPLPY